MGLNYETQSPFTVFSLECISIFDLLQMHTEKNTRINHNVEGRSATSLTYERVVGREA
jgi:hypothetical protein